jgi:hypothetical protein
MPRYHFNVFNDFTSLDDEGRDLPDIAAAVEEAIRSTRELIGHEIMAGRAVHQSHRIEIADDAENVLHTVRFGEIVRLEP